MSTLMTIMAIAPLAGPTLGGRFYDSACAGLILIVNTWTDWGGLPLMIFACLLFVAATGLLPLGSVVAVY